MGKFGGFESSALEIAYNKLVFALMFVLQKGLVLHAEALGEASQGILGDDEVRMLRKTYGRLLSLEGKKVSQPKFTLALKHIV